MKVFFKGKYFRLLVLFVICIVVGLQAVATDEIANFLIFKTATQKFFMYQNPYDFIQYKIIYDKFYYAPQFMVLFYLLTLIPLPISIILWLLVSALLFWLALEKLPLDTNKKWLFFSICLVDLVNSLQNLQTNVMNVAFIFFIFIFLQRGKPALAGFFVAICLSIKIYPAAAALLFFFYPGKLRFIMACFLFTAFFFLLPFIFLESGYVIDCFKNWIASVKEDSSNNEIARSFSLVGINYSWFSKPINHFYIQLAGLIFIFAPIAKVLKHSINESFIFTYLSLLMITMVIFNHVAESPTYIIVTAGVALWYLNSSKNLLTNILLFLFFTACVLTPTDIYPKVFRTDFLAYYKIRVIPCFLIWIKIAYELMSYKNPKAIEATA